MKLKIFFSILSIAALAVSCRPDKYEVMSIAEKPVDNLTGTWKLTKVIQKDEQSEIKNSPYVSMDVTNLLPYNTMSIRLDSKDGVPTNFVVTPGTAPQVIKNNTGKWLINDTKQPTKARFINGVDTTYIDINSYPRSFDNSFELKVYKYEQPSGKLAQSYTYQFTKQ